MISIRKLPMLFNIQLTVLSIFVLYGGLLVGDVLAMEKQEKTIFQHCPAPVIAGRSIMFPRSDVVKIQQKVEVLALQIRQNLTQENHNKGIILEVEPQVTYEMLPEEMQLAVMGQLIPATFNNGEEFADTVQNLSCVAQINRIHSALVAIRELKRKLFYAIPSDKVFFEGITELKKRKFNAKTEEEKARTQVLALKGALKIVKKEIEIFDQIPTIDNKNTLSPKGRAIVQFIEERGLNSNFVINNKRFLQYGMGRELTKSDLALLLLKKYHADPVMLQGDDLQILTFDNEIYNVRCQKLIKLLIKKGLDQNYKAGSYSYFKFLLYYALLLVKGSSDKKTDLIKFLLKKGTNNLVIQSDDGISYYTIIEYAQKYLPETLELFEKYQNNTVTK